LRVRPENRFEILYICTGNICRSPVAERLLAARLGPPVGVSSAGTFGLVGSPIAGPMVPRLVEAGADPGDFRARRLTAEMIQRAHVVLGLTRGHRGDAVELVPAAVRRAFTLLEFARVLGSIDPGDLPAGTPAERLKAAVPLAASRRGGTRGRDDVDDPFGLDDGAYQRAFDEIETAVDTIAAVVNGSAARDRFDAS
jgi:protein-tyrosine phosphatase